MSTGEIIASILGEFEDFLRKVGKMEIFDTLVYNYRLKPSISNLTPELFTDLFTQLLDKLLELKNNLLQWHSIQEFTLSPFQAALPTSISSPTSMNEECDISVNSSVNPGNEDTIVSAIVTGISDTPYNEDFDITSHLDECSRTDRNLNVRSFPIREQTALPKSHGSTETDAQPLKAILSCTDSSEDDRSQPMLKEVANINETKKSFLCQTCGKKYSTVQSLTAHLNVHTKSKIFKCSFCGKDFMRKDKLIFHEAIHTGVKSFTCEICGKSFSRKTKLDEHLRRHIGLKKYKCQKCSKLYASNRDLRHHLEKHDCSSSADGDGQISRLNNCQLPALQPMGVQPLETDDVTITQEVSEIFKLNWPELQFPPEVELDHFNLDNSFVLH